MIEKLGKYRIDGVLGKGAMGVVYKGFDPFIERVVALKSIHKQLLIEHPEMGLIARFKNEAQAAGRLTHPNIVAVYEYGETEDNAFIAMEFVHSTPLASLMQNEKPAELAATVSWISQLLRALDYAHSRGVVHRDIKPANLLIERDGHLKITDFGIARIEASTLTQVGSVVGTPCYMSPEQFRGETADGRSDIFACGVLLYQLLTGVRPFSGSSHEIMYQVMNEIPPRPSQRNPLIGPHFDTVVAKAMAKSNTERYETARAFMEALLQAYRISRNPALGSHAESEDMTVLALQVPAEQLSDILPTPREALPDASQLNATLLTDTPWKLEALPELESLLSTQIGPMAKVFLRKSAQQAGSLQDLCDDLMQHIPNEKGRTAFQQGVHQLKKKLGASSSSLGLNTMNSSRLGATSLNSGGGSLTSVGGTSMANAASAANRSGMRTSTGMGPGLTPEIHAEAEKKLTAYIGPIAKIVCKRAAGKTAYANEFYRLLADNLATEAERTKFLRECGLSA